MVSPKGPSGSKRGKAASATAKDLSADDFERLATIFRPSWKLDDAPFTSGGAASGAGAGAHPQDQNGSHPVAVAPIVFDEAPFTTIVGTPAPPSIPLDTIPSAPPRPASRSSAPPAAPTSHRPTAPSWHPEAPAAPLPGSRTTTSSWPALPPSPEAVAAPVAVGPQAAAPQPAAPQPMVAAAIPGTRTTVAWPAPPSDDSLPPAQRPTVPSWTAEADRSPFTPPAVTPSGQWASLDSRAARTKLLKRGHVSRKPMWIGLGVAAAAAGAGLWLWVAGNDAHPTIAPAPSPPTETTVVQAPARTESPPPPAVSAAAPIAPEPPPPKAEPPPHEQPAPTMPPVVTAAPLQAPPPREPAAAPAAPRPVRPKPASQTIVHDVPF
jgi:hypothetical protein